MTDITMALKELLRKRELDIDSDFLRAGVQMMMQMLIESEASEQLGAGVYERVGTDRQCRFTALEELSAWMRRELSARNQTTQPPDFPLSQD
jgi:transposase-like protein